MTRQLGLASRPMNESLLLIVLMLSAGYVSARLSLLPDNAADTLQRFVIYVCLPALVLSIVPSLRWQPGLLWVVLTPWLLLGVGVAAVLVAARTFAFSDGVKAALLLCVPIGNTSFLGFPMLEALVGRDAIQVGLLYDQLGSFLILATYGLFIVARFGSGETPTPLAIVLRVFRFPSFVALCVGLMIQLAPDAWPSTAHAIVTRVGATLVPIAMFAVGLKLQLRPPRPWQPFAFGLSMKMVVFPLLAFGLTQLLGLTGVPARVIVLESGMPSSISMGALAIMAGFAPELAAAMVGYGILLSLLTLPVFAGLG